MPTLTASKFVSNVPAVDPDEPIPYALTDRGWAAPRPDGEDEPTRGEIMQALFAVKGE